MSPILLCIGVLGAAGMTWLFPAVAAVAVRFLERRRRITVVPRPGSGTGHLTVTVAIPVYNEAAKLARTLASVTSAISRCRWTHPEVHVRVLVGCDGCADDSASVARAAKATVLQAEHNRGKWRTLEALLEHAGDSEWIIFADAGVEWPRSLLTEIAVLLRDEALVGIAPTFEHHGAGYLERWHWVLERRLKTLENLSGGPVSVHGATVAYRVPAVRKIFRRYSGDWQNDDVVIPLLLRAEFPRKQIRYLERTPVFEQFAGGRERPRRSRMAQGNAAWLRGLWGEVLRKNRLVAMLALRRVFRLLWAYWFIALALGLAGTFSRFAVTSAAIPLVAAGAGFGAVLVLWFLDQKGSGVLSALRASLLSPLYLMSLTRKGIPWR